MKLQSLRRDGAFLRLISCALAVGFYATGARAASFAVSNTADAGAGSLRQAILDANASPGADLIDARKISGFVQLKSALPDLSDVTLIGSGRDQLTVYGNDQFRVFNVPDGNVTLASISISSGNAPIGAGVRNGAGKLTLSSVRFSANVAKNATATYGGALYSSGPVVARDCLFVGNGARGEGGHGGAIYMNLAPLELNNCEIEENYATAFGGAVMSYGGGRVSIRGGNFTKNVVADANSANYAGFETVVSGVGYGGALHLSGQGAVSISGTTFEQNIAGKAGGAIWSGNGGTLIADSAKFIFNIVRGAAPSDGGGAIYNDAGTVTVRNSDLQRNYVFDVGNGGAILNNGGSLSVAGSQFVHNNSLYGGAIETVGGQVTLGNADFTGNFAGNYGGGQRPEVLLGVGGALHARSAARVFLLGGTLLNNGATLSGGALWNDRTSIVRVDGAIFEANEAYYPDAGEGGGALFNAGGALTVRGARLLGNRASGTAGAGGAIFNDGGTLQLNASALDANVAQRAGGAIETVGGRANLVDVALTNNQTGADENPGDGGALHVAGAGQALLAGGEVSGNGATAQGGALWNGARATLVVSGTKVSGNVANEGGGIYNDGGSLAIRGATLELNRAQLGGGVFNVGSASIVGATLSANSAQSAGGAIASSGALTISESLVQRNRATRAGGAIENAGDATVVRSSILNNAAEADGGALHNSGTARAFVIASTVAANTAQGEGGALWNSAGATLAVRNSTLDGNAARMNGGGIYNASGNLSLDSATITGNSAQSAGGGIASEGGTFNSLNSVIALNFSSLAPDVCGAFNSQGYNLIGVSPGNIARSGDLSGTKTNPLDPKLNPLASNGGLTQTHLPRNGSPLINAGNTSQTVDQRGVARAPGARKTIGSVEVGGAAQSARTVGSAPSGGSS